MQLSRATGFEQVEGNYQTKVLRATHSSNNPHACGIWRRVF